MCNFNEKLQVNIKLDKRNSFKFFKVATCVMFENYISIMLRYFFRILYVRILSFFLDK